MRQFFRLLPIAVSLLAAAIPLGLASLAHAEDLATRMEAIRLLQHADAVSSPSHVMPNHKQDVQFRAYAVDGTAKNGTLEAIFSPDANRHEIVFENYDAISITYTDRRVQNDYQPAPPETLEMARLIPLHMVHFDKSDVIGSINPSTLFGRAAKCIQFQTINGRTYESNEICLDTENGTLLRLSVGNEVTENADFFDFEGMLLPKHIRHYINGTLRMEIEQQFTRIDTPIDWTALTPPHPHYFHFCKQSQRPVLLSGEQPAGAGPGPWYDVKVQAVIDLEGRVEQANVLPKGRPDLEKQAIAIVSNWKFSPAICNGHPTVTYADITVHFPPQ
ncbi:MAG TPA: energy transducer TonB [Candidatus Acidoferrum sp.]|nr:energy transducer TonB [Candidatus Acidoferrum sp.]